MQREAQNAPWKPRELKLCTGDIGPNNGHTPPPHHGMERAMPSCLLWGERATYTEEVGPTGQPGT